ncbi:MAG TPA: PIG-L family deacetylase [Actinomycetes bacterium]|jgi:LmbE family N-acetylglucosaminyl deacetylase|nr:PIG-L family deacetylase [Actinomycetes bacterium]
MVVVAHPDDDAYGCAGTVALHADDPRFRFLLVHATDGEAGRIAPGSNATRKTLGAIRREEDRRAWQVLGRQPDRHEWLGYPDGGLAELPLEELVDRIAVILAEERPDVVLTFGPDGITGHPDHITVGQATTQAFLRHAGDDGPGLRRLVHGAIRQSVIDRFNARRVARGMQPWDPTRIYHLRGIPDERIDVDIDTSGVAHRVRAAMLEHRTQWEDVNSTLFTDSQKVKAVSREPGVIAWPGRPGRILRDLFEDL